MTNTVFAPRYFPPRLEIDGEVVHQPMERAERGSFVDFNYLANANKEIVRLTELNATLQEELEELRRINELRPLLEESVMAMTRALVEQTIGSAVTGKPTPAPRATGTLKTKKVKCNQLQMKEAA